MERIRAMTPEDFPAIMEIYGQSLEKGTVTFQQKIPSYAEWDAGHSEDCRLLLESDGIPVGFAVISPTSRRAPYRGVAELSIYLDEKFRHRGCGTKLLRQLIEETELKGYWMLIAVVFAENQASLALMQKCGFRLVGYRERIAQDRFGQWHNTVLLERRSRILY